MVTIYSSTMDPGIYANIWGIWILWVTKTMNTHEIP